MSKPVNHSMFSRRLRLRKQAEPSKQKKQKKKIEKPKAVAKKSAATGPSDTSDKT